MNRVCRYCGQTAPDPAAEPICPGRDGLVGPHSWIDAADQTREHFDSERAWIYDDGGRAEAGFKGETGDCVTRAISIAARRPYLEVYRALNELAPLTTTRGRRSSSSRTGVFRKTYDAYLDQLGWTWTATMRIGEGCTTHLRADELPDGRLIARLSRHLCAVIDGTIHDISDPSRGGTRCVYGYWTPPAYNREAD